MSKYISTKLVQASYMTRLDYNEYRGWELPANENGNDAGYLLEQAGASNDERHKGYISWSPIDLFNESHREAYGMPFGLAVEALKLGKKIARAGWNGIEMFVYLVDGSTFTVNRKPLLGIYPEGTVINYRPHMDIRTADGTIATWSPSGSDALADDWYIVGEEDE